MPFAVLADAVLVLHALFVVYAVAGAALVLRWRWSALAHLPTVAWAGWIELSGGICPLTPLELRLRALAGERGYSGGFLEHYLLAWLYPEGLTRTHQLVLGLGVLALNAALYLWVLRRRRDQV